MVMRPKELTDLTDYTASSVRTMFNSSGKLVFAPHNLIKSSEDFSSSDWTKVDTTVTSNAAMAPDGTLTADKISHTSTSADIYQNIPIVDGTTYGYGICLKYVDHQWVHITLETTGTWVDIQNGVFGTNTLGLSITPLADGWYYISGPHAASGTPFYASTKLVAGNGSYTETSGTSAYIWGAHLYENGLGGMADVPEDERAIPALTKYVPNKAVETGSNLVSNGTFDSNTSGWTDGPNGHTTSIETTGVRITNNGATQGYITQAISTEVGATYMISASITYNGGFARVEKYSTPAAPGGNGISVNESGTFHYYFTADAATSYIVVGNRNDSGVYNDFDNITVTKVDRNPSAARFLPRRNGYIRVNGSWVRGLTWESEARTNLFGYHIPINAQWSKTGATITENTVAAPDGTTTASTITEDSTASLFHFAAPSAPPSMGATAHTVSCYLKAGTATTASLFLSQSGNNGALFDLSAGTVSSVTGTGNTANIEDVSNGWYRCSVTNDGGADLVDQLRIGVADGALFSSNGDGVSSVHVWGFQIEQGSTPSSLIPTYGATRTRTAETLLDKADKIVWPATTYVSGTELVTNGTFDTDTSGWSEQDVNATFTVTNGQLTIARGATGSGYVSQPITTVSGSVYRATIDLIDDGPLDFRVGTTIAAGDIASTGTVTTSGSYELIFVATGTTTHISGVNPTNSTSVTFDNISVKEINPRAKCVVMHGYMTYADTGVSGEVSLWRQRLDASNLLESKIDTTTTLTGRVTLVQLSNGTADYAATSDTFYSPGANVPFKIASRYLDNAIQGAADGTATTENTTPPGLPDLSSAPTEWFYDFMGHVTGVSVFVDDIGESGLTFGTGNTYLA